MATPGLTLASLFVSKIDNFHKRAVLKVCIPLDPAIPFVEIYSKKCFRILICKDLFTELLITALFLIIKVGNHKK